MVGSGSGSGFVVGGWVGAPDRPQQRRLSADNTLRLCCLPDPSPKHTVISHSVAAAPHFDAERGARGVGGSGGGPQHGAGPPVCRDGAHRRGREDGWHTGKSKAKSGLCLAHQSKHKT